MLKHADAVQIGVEKASSDVSIYQYDATTSLTYDSYNSNQIYEANYFVAQSFEEIYRAGFYTIDDKVTQYDVYLYKNVEKSGNSLTGTVVSHETGTVSYPGYHTVNFSTPLTVNKGDNFMIVVKTSNSSGKAYYLYDANTISKWFKTESHSQAGQSYLSTDGQAWTDVSITGSKNLRVKAYSKKKALITSLTLTNIPEQMQVGQTLKINKTIAPTTSVEPVQYSSNHPEIISVDENGNLKALAQGTAIITAKTTNCMVQKVIEVIPSLNGIQLSNTTLKFYREGMEKQIHILVNPTELSDQVGISYSSSNTSIVTVDESGCVTSVGKGEAYITVTVTWGTKELKVYCVCYVEDNIYETSDISEIVMTAEPSDYTTIKYHLNYDPYIDAYALYRSTDGKKYTFLKEVTPEANGDVTETLSDKVTYNKTYYYKVVGYYSRNNGDMVTQTSNVIKVKAMLAPVTLKSAVGGTKSVTVTWDKVKGASGYTIYRATSENGTYTAVKSVSSKTTSYKNTGLTYRKQYFYKVRAYRVVNGKKVYGAYGNVEYAYPGPANVTSLKANTTYNSTKLTWSAVANVDGYIVDIYNPTLKKWVEYTDTTSTTVSITGLTFNTDYKIRVSTYVLDWDLDEFLEGTPTTISIHTGLAKPTVTLTKYGIGAVCANWNAVKGADGYQVQRKLGSSGKWATVQTSDANTMLSYKLKIGSTYYYRVRAYRIDANGNKVYSAWSTTTSKKVGGVSIIKHTYPYKLYSTNKDNYMTITSVSAKPVAYNTDGSWCDLKITFTFSKAVIKSDDPFDIYMKILTSIPNAESYESTFTYTKMGTSKGSVTVTWKNVPVDYYYLNF